jgi:esterase/lipase/1-acyl-sn-glycerol-3-phosphate acyltransferase
MNRFAYRMTALAIKTISELSKAEIFLHGTEQIPNGSLIFVINHFTRLETFLMPYHIFKLTKVPVWSLASYEFFTGAMGAYLDKIGAVSTSDPDRDRLIVRSLLTGEAVWIIFPEGRMVKNKKIIEKGRYMISWAGGKHPPHTGAATLALRTEFYRQRIRRLLNSAPDEVQRLMDLFQIDSLDSVLNRITYIVPVNLTYYPVRARENLLSQLAARLVDDLPDRIMEEIMTEGSMLLSGVDIDIRFGKPIQVGECLRCSEVEMDLATTKKIDFDDPIRSKAILRKEALKLMQRYMAAIYGLTTVNHDNLFASILRWTKYRRIEEQDLRRRVFLAAVALRRNATCYVHRKLEEDQIPLLTDDRSGWAKDFMSVALESKVLKKDGAAYSIDYSKFSSPYDFYRVRIDNPIEVMANAVEPLTELQRRIRLLALLPDFWIRRQIARYLIRQAVSEFEKDYREFFVAGESKPLSIGMPCLLKGRSRGIGVLLIHGYMAAPAEVRELARYLNRKGYWVYLPRLKGHGTSPEDLAIRTYLDWQQSVDAGYAIISSLCKKIVVGGFSTGAGLALDLALRIRQIVGVFAVSTPLQLKDFGARLAPALDLWNRLMEKTHRGGAKMEFVENKPENPHINYSRNPISGVREIERLMDKIEPKLHEIQVPALVIQSSRDPVVDPKGSKRIFDLLGSDNKDYMLVNYDRHGILLGPDAGRVHQGIAEFVQQFRKSRQ